MDKINRSTQRRLIGSVAEAQPALRVQTSDQVSLFILFQTVISTAS